MANAKLLFLADAISEGYNLPKFLSSKFRNLLSADGCTYFLVSTPYRKVTRLHGSKRKSTEILSFDKRYPAQSIEAIFVGIRKDICLKPIDCSYVDSSSVLVHLTPKNKIIATAARLDRIKSGSAIAVFDVTSKLLKALHVKPTAAKSVHISGTKGSKTVRISIDFATDSASGGISNLSLECFGIVYESFSVEVCSKALKRNLLEGDFAVRLNEFGMLELDSPDIDGTLYISGKRIN